MATKTPKPSVTKKPKTSTALAKSPSTVWNAAGAANGMTFEELAALAEQQGSRLDQAGVSPKEELIGMPMIITRVVHKAVGSYGTPWCVVEAILEDDRKVVFTDGSTGILRQLVTPEGELACKLPLFVPSGLRRSQYEHPEFGPAETYYLDGTAPVESSKKLARAGRGAAA